MRSSADIGKQLKVIVTFVFLGTKAKISAEGYPCSSNPVWKQDLVLSLLNGDPSIYRKDDADSLYDWCRESCTSFYERRGGQEINFIFV